MLLGKLGTGTGGAPGQTLPVSAQQGTNASDGQGTPAPESSGGQLVRVRATSAKSDQVKGHAKEAAGIVIADKDLESEGKNERLTGEAEEKVDHAKDKIVELIDNAKDKLDESVTRPRTP